MNNQKNLMGEKFGKLTVLFMGQKSKDYKQTWVCRCSCGNTVECRSVVDGWRLKIRWLII